MRCAASSPSCSLHSEPAPRPPVGGRPGWVTVAVTGVQAEAVRIGGTATFVSPTDAARRTCPAADQVPAADHHREGDEDHRRPGRVRHRRALSPSPRASAAKKAAGEDFKQAGSTACGAVGLAVCGGCASRWWRRDLEGGSGACAVSHQRDALTSSEVDG